MQKTIADVIKRLAAPSDSRPSRRRRRRNPVDPGRFDKILDVERLLDPDAVVRLQESAGRKAAEEAKRGVFAQLRRPQLLPIRLAAAPTLVSVRRSL